MARDITSQQSPLRYRPDIQRLNLLKLTTYSDRAAKTADQVFYLAEQDVVYDYGNTGTNQDFWPVVKQIGRLSASIPHLPQPDDAELLRKPLEVQLSNEDYKGDRLINLFRDTHTLENAELEWAQLLLEERPTGPRLDLSALAGNEHTVWYRGRVVRVAPITEQAITLQLETDIPSVDWIRVNETWTDPRDQGARIAIVYGEAKRVRAFNWGLPGISTLTQNLDGGDTSSLLVTDTSVFPQSGLFHALIGAERVILKQETPISATSLDISTRGNAGTDDVQHFEGDQLTEIPAALNWIITGNPSKDVQKLYAMNLFGNLVEVTTGTFNLADSSTIAGHTVTSYTLTGYDDVMGLVKLISQQISADGTDPGTGTQAEAPPTGAQIANSAPGGAFWDHSGGSVIKIVGHTSNSDKDWLRHRWTSVISPDAVVIRWRWMADSVVANQAAPVSPAIWNTRITCHMGGSSMPGGNPPAKSLQTGNYTTAKTTTWNDVRGTWHTPTVATTMDDLRSAAGPPEMRLFCSNGPVGGWPAAGYDVTWNGVGIEAEVEATSTAPTAVITSGFRIALYADVDGYVAPTATPVYKAGTGNLITEPADILRHWIEEIGGGTVDADSYDDADTDLADNVLAFDARTMGNTWEEVAARIAYESRVTLVPEETATGQVWKLLTASSSYQYPTAGDTVSEWDRGSFAEASRELETELASSFFFVYAPDWSLGENEEAFTLGLFAAPGNNDLTLPSNADLLAAEDAFGLIVAEPFAFRAIQDTDTAKEVAGFYAHELIRPAALFSLSGAAWWEGYHLEVGDILNLTPPWRTSAVKCRLIAYEKDVSQERLDLTAVEVE